MRRHPRGLIAGVVVALALPCAAGAQARISEAEKLLFQTDHLKNVAPTATLAYAFAKTGAAEAAFDDAVEVRVRGAVGAKSVTVEFFTGPRRIAYPELTRAEGNPVLLYFLERDIREMERLTGGKPGYFRNAIRRALARSARVTQTRIVHDGQTLAAREVTVAPYLDDPLKARIGKYASKLYVFTLSADVPGSVYSLRATVPSAAGTATGAPLIEERLRFVRVGR
jgi:hypothetical protein